MGLWAEMTSQSIAIDLRGGVGLHTQAHRPNTEQRTSAFLTNVHWKLKCD